MIIWKAPTHIFFINNFWTYTVSQDFIHKIIQKREIINKRRKIDQYSQISDLNLPLPDHGSRALMSMTFRAPDDICIYIYMPLSNFWEYPQILFCCYVELTSPFPKK